MSDKFEEKMDATILGIVYHPEVRGLSENTKKDIAEMIKIFGQASRAQAIEDVVENIDELIEVEETLGGNTNMLTFIRGRIEKLKGLKGV